MRIRPISVIIALAMISMTGTLPAAELLSVNEAGNASGNAASELDENDSTLRFGAYVVFRSEATDLTAVPNPLGTGNVYRRNTITGVTEMVSVNHTGTAAGNQSSGVARMSSDGRYVFFESEADDLVAIRPPGSTINIFVRDMVTGMTSPVSVDQSGSSGSDQARLSDVSPDGRYVVFYSDADDLTAETDINDSRDVFVRDLVAETTILVSVDTSGTATGDSQSSDGSITPDGRYVFFHATASNLVPVDTNNDNDAFRRDMITGTTELVSVNLAGTDSANSYSYSAYFSDDGNIAVFESNGDDLTTIPDGNATVDFFVRDMAAGTTTLITTNSTGTSAANGYSSETESGMTPDGRFISFTSESTDLHPLDTDTDPDIFVYDRQTGVNTLVSVNVDGTASGNAWAGDGSISGDGRWFGFSSNSSDLVHNDNNGESDVFVRDMDNGRTYRLSTTPGGARGGGGSYAGLLSADSNWLFFDSGSDDLSPLDSNMAFDVFRSPVPIFADGFEAGDLSWWDETMP